MRKIISIVLFIVILTLFSSCGTTYKWVVDDSFDRAIIKLPDGNIIDVEIKEWSSASYKSEIAIVDKSGTIYRVNSVNCILIKEGKPDENT